MTPSQTTTAPRLSAALPGGAEKIVLGTTAFDLEDVGYVAEEHFLDGEATAFVAVGEMADDGHWSLRPDSQAPYVTRLVVYRPRDPGDFSGVALVEWINVSPSSDVAPVWGWAHREMTRAGHVWIGVSVQRAGIEGGGFYPGPMPPLKAADPERYGGLRLPGDAYAFDMFSQAAQLIRDRLGREGWLPGYTPRRVLALGASQSASFLLAYINGLGGLGLFDGYLLSGRISVAAGFDGTVPSSQGAVRIRGDLGAPVMTVQSETDVVGRRGSFRARQPDGPVHRLWEIAGAAHMDTYNLIAHAVDSGSIPITALAEALAPVDNLLGFDLGRLLNSGPQQHYILQAAIAHLVRWADGGAPPPAAAPLSVLACDPPQFELDANGMAKGGVRSPWVDAPRARLSGFWRADVQPPLSQFGVTEPFDADRLAKLYQSDEDYLEKFDAQLSRGVEAGYFLSEDRDEMRGLARAALRPR